MHNCCFTGKLSSQKRAPYSKPSNSLRTQQLSLVMKMRKKTARAGTGLMWSPGRWEKNSLFSSQLQQKLLHSVVANIPWCVCFIFSPQDSEKENLVVDVARQYGHQWRPWHRGGTEGLRLPVQPRWDGHLARVQRQWRWHRLGWVMDWLIELNEKHSVEPTGRVKSIYSLTKFVFSFSVRGLCHFCKQVWRNYYLIVSKIWPFLIVVPLHRVLVIHKSFRGHKLWCFKCVSV